MRGAKDAVVRDVGAQQPGGRATIAMDHDRTVRVEHHGPVALVAIVNPPVNATSIAVRTGLMQAFQTLAADRDIKVIALYGDGATFVAGADIREIGRPVQAPLLTAVCSAIEAQPQSVVAVLHGTTLGGGLEIALAAHARVALAGTAVGLPEVKLGVIPGAGGTQRLPRLVGQEMALDLITTGRTIKADEALAIGLVDRMVDGEPRSVAKAAAEEVLAGTFAVRRTGERIVMVNEAALAQARARLKADSSHLVAPLKAVDAVAASTLPLDKGLAAERALFDECVSTPQRVGLIHAFFAERMVRKIPEADVVPRRIQSAAVVGAEATAAHAAASLLRAGLRLTLIDPDRGALSRAVERIAGRLVAADERHQLLAERLTTSQTLDAAANADVVLEAVEDEMASKHTVFAALDTVAKPGAILAATTANVDLDAMARVTSRQADVVGLHFFAPERETQLLEVAVGEATAPDVVSTAFALARRIDKVAVRTQAGGGLIANRLLRRIHAAAEEMALFGASPEEVDRALQAFGFPTGPFLAMDLSGLDIVKATRGASEAAAERERPVLDRLIDVGWLGQTTGRGFYLHANGTALPNPDVLPMIAHERAKRELEPGYFNENEIVARFLAAMIVEGVEILEDRTALRPIDIDAVALFGLAFPRWRGGPMLHADGLGAEDLVRRVERYAFADGAVWQVPPLLQRMASERIRFADLNDGMQLEDISRRHST